MAVENYVSVLLFLFFTLAVAQGLDAEWKVTDIMVKFWAQNIGRDMDKFTRETTGWSTLKQKYAESEFEVVDEDELVKNIGKKMKTFFSEKIDALLKLVSVAEDAYRKHVYNPSLTSYPYYNAKNLGSELVLTRDPRFQTEVNTSESAIHVPTDIYDEAPDIVNVIEWTAALDKQFIINMKNYPDLVWQYFGNVEGVLRTFPAQKWRNGPNNVDLYDCRGRAWYIQGSSSPKNIVILIDSSGSMHGMPLQIAKLAVQTLIDTLSNDDYFNVVYFKQVPKSLFCEHEAKLLQATKYNREYAKGLLHEIGATNISVWMTGLYEAFDVLKKAEVDHIGADCQQAIMIFSDGTSKDMQEVFEERNADKKVRVFTYAVGPPGNTIEPLKRMANNNKGSFATIPSIGSVRGVMVDYVTVLGRPLAIENNHSSLWTNTYLDAWGLGMMTTGTVPVFSNKTEDKKKFLELWQQMFL